MPAPSVPEIWASGAGANVATGLTATDADYTGEVTDSRVRYALVTYTFSGSPDLSAVLPGHLLVIPTGEFANAENNGSHYITARDNTAKTITVRMTAATRFDASLDETGQTAAASVTNGGAGIQAPTTAKQNQGYVVGEKPNVLQLNWLLNNLTTIADYLMTGGARNGKTAEADIGYSKIASSSYTAIGGEGYDICPIKTTGYSATVGSGGFADVTGSTASPLTTAANRVLVGACFTADYAGTDNSGQARLAINGTGLASDYNAYLPVENAPICPHYLISSATGGLEAYKAQVNGTSNVAVTKGNTWACEFPAAAAAGAANAESAATTTSTSYVDLTSMSITISPTNNPVLLLFTGNVQHGNATDTTKLRFYDGSTAYGEWLSRYHIAAGSARHSASIGWLTGDLNGSITFKVQQASGAGETVGVNERNFTAIEITGDTRSAAPSGTCATSSTEATITDGSTPLSITFTPDANRHYLAVLTGYSERTASTGYLTLKIKNGSTVLVEADNARDSAANYKTPFCLSIPTGQLASGVAVTITATAQTSEASTTHDLKNMRLFLVEAAPVTDPISGDPASVEIEDIAQGGTEVIWDGQIKCSANAALGLALYEAVDGDPAVLVKEKLLTAPGTADISTTLHYQRPTNLPQGSDVAYEVRAKIASGFVEFRQGSTLAVKELPRDDL